MKTLQYIFKKSAALFFLLISLSLLTISCQEDKIIVENPPPEQTIEPGSDLVNLMAGISENDGSVDNIIDETSCSSIQFPFTVIAGGIEVTIDSIEDLLIIQQIIDDNPGGASIEILFPITIILPDYSIIVIENQEAFDIFIATCDPNPNECVDFVYPISFSIFNLEFELVETVVITNDFELFFFLQDLNDNSGNIVSLNFPVSLEYDNGTTIEVTTNVDLATAIAAGSDNCADIVDPDPDPDPDNLCPALVVETYLLECFWYPRIYDGDQDNPFEYYHFTFNDGGFLEMTTSDAFSLDALWDVVEVGEETILELEAFQPFLGNWKVLECSEEEFLLEREDGILMTLTRDCGFDLAQCTGSGLGICDDDLDGFLTLDFNEITDMHFDCNDALEYSITFHETYEDADNGTNPLASPYQTTVSGSQTFYYSITELSTGLIKYVSSWQIDAEDCGGCNNPGLLIDDLIVYMPFASSITELISNQNLPVNGAFLAEDREDNFCALGLNENSTANPFDTSPENWIEEFDDFSISIWFKMQNTDVGDFEIMFSTGQFETDGFTLGVSDLNTPIFLANATGVNLFDSDWNEEVDVVWTNTDWHHLVITHQGNLTQMFRDGILRDETTVDINIGGAIDTGYILNGFVNKFKGNIDDLRVYKKALNPNEIFILFNDDGDCNTCLD